MTTYNVTTEQAEKLAIRANSRGGESALNNPLGNYLLYPPASVVATPSTSGGYLPATTTYYYYITRVSNGVESFSSPVQTTTTGAGATNSVTFAITDATVNTLRPVAASSFNLYVGTTAANATLQATTGTTTLTWTKYSSPVTIAAASITTNSSAWTVTASNTLTVGQSVTISGVVPTAYNGTYTVASVIGTPPGYTGFTITNSLNPGAVTTAGTATTVPYSSSPAVVSYPEASVAFGAYQNPTWVSDVVVHTPGLTGVYSAQNGYSGVPITGTQQQVRQIRTSVQESQIYSRTDTATLTILSTTTGGITYSGNVITVAATGVTSTNLPVGSVVTISGSSTTAFNGTWNVATVTAGTGFTINAPGLGSPSNDTTVGRTIASNFVLDTSVTWNDFGKPVTGTGVPTNAYVGAVTSGVGFSFSSVQGQNYPYFPATATTTTLTGFVATSAGTAITVTGSNVGPIPSQVGQYRTTRWQG